MALAVQLRDAEWDEYPKPAPQVASQHSVWDAV